MAGEIAFGKDGEWANAPDMLTQFQNVAPNNLEQFRDGHNQPILWPPEYKTGDMIYPYAKREEVAPTPHEQAATERWRLSFRQTSRFVLKDESISESNRFARKILR